MITYGGLWSICIKRITLHEVMYVVFACAVVLTDQAFACSLYHKCMYFGGVMYHYPQLTSGLARAVTDSNCLHVK